MRLLRIRKPIYNFLVTAPLQIVLQLGVEFKIGTQLIDSLQHMENGLPRIVRDLLRQFS